MITAMKVLLFLFIISFAAASHHPRLQLILPKQIVKSEDIHGYCIAESRFLPRMRIASHGHCYYKINLIKRERNFNYSRVDVVIKNVTETCTYQCFSLNLHVTKTVTVVGMLLFT